MQQVRGVVVHAQQARALLPANTNEAASERRRAGSLPAHGAARRAVASYRRTEAKGPVDALIVALTRTIFVVR